MRFILSIALLLIFFQLSANEKGLPIIKNFSVEDYLGGSRIYSIVSTDDGLIYAGDKSGIIQFDGTKWRKVTCGYTVKSLAIDTSNAIYVAGDKGIGKLVVEANNQLRYESLNQYITSEKKLRKYRYAEVFNVDGRIVFALGKEIIINTAENIRIIESQHNFKYYQKLNNDLYFYSPEDGVFRLEENKLSLVSDHEAILNQDVRGFLYLNDKLQILMGDRGVFSLENHSLSLFSELNEEIDLKQLKGVSQIDNQTYALKTYYNGVILIDSDGHVINKYQYNEGLINNTVFCIHKDSWKNLWIGTAAGISVVHLNYPYTKYNDHHGLGIGFSSIKFKDKIYFATSQGLYYLHISDKGNKEFRKLINGHVWALHEIGGVLYYGTASGLFSYNEKEIKRINYYPCGWYITQIPDNPEYYLTGSPMGVLLLKKDSENQLVNIRLLDGLKGNVGNIEIDSNKLIWAEFEKGILRCKLSEDYKELEEVRKYDRLELNNKFKRVRKIDEQVFFVADSGLYSYGGNNHFEKDSSFSFIFRNGDSPTNLIVDRYKRLWFFDDGSVKCYTKSKNEIKPKRLIFRDFAYDTYPVDYENVYCLDSLNIIIGQEEGFLGSDLSFNELTQFSANRIREVVEVLPDGSSKYLKSRTGQLGNGQVTEAIEGIKYGNPIKFYYTVGSGNYNEIKYSTLLEGHNEKWSNWSKETIKEYMGLAPGDYRFMVRAINKARVESVVAIYTFKVLAPWYLRMEAKITYFILLFILIFAVERAVRFRTKKVHAKIKKEQEELLYRKEQTQIQNDLKKQKELVKLKNEKLRIDNLYKSKELANSTMGVIKKNQFLTDLKEELEKIKMFSEQNKLVTSDISNVIRRINRDIDNEENWKVFEDYFDRVHEKFLSKMKSKYPILTPKDLRLSAYLRMNLSTKEIAPLMNITVRGVEISRYRLRKKLELGRNDSLNDFLINL